jgi:hypothetical protein
MPRESKIIKYNLEDEVKQLMKLGYTNQAEITRVLIKNHPEIEDLKNLSQMSVGRYIKSMKEDNIEQAVKEGRNPVGEFIDKVESIYSMNQKLYDKCISILDEVEQNTDDNSTKFRAIKEARDTLTQMRKSQESLIQFGERESKNIQNVNLKKEYNVKIMLLDISKRLCPKCRNELVNILEIKED